ncbi:hypothetical protein QQF54_08760 [Lelliottia sp. V106_10]|uniref:hypothetical protein n=1 Tax=Lelliottia wanjuensis TaxID=3050585 RepID=UPI00254B8789|nr:MULTISPECIES: hypothetical protein [unclassified Lelliottia]MDK9373445.1 hypothetical protein [Lelliottia sp. V106_10]MDK9600238.1 hypothetical protein [Lelliottia sp. V106_5]
MDETTDWSQWFTLDENGEPVFAEGMTGSNKALATEKYYEYLNMAVNEKIG